VIFFIPLAFGAPVRGPRRNIVIPFGSEKLEWCSYPTVKKSLKMFNRFDRIPACDGQTDRQPSCDGIVRAMHSIAR